jgi:hypothetical protein
MNEKQELYYKKLSGKNATIRFDSGHGLQAGTPIYIAKYNAEHDKFVVQYNVPSSRNQQSSALVPLADINLRDEKYNLKNIIFKGHRDERPDKYEDSAVIELLPDKKNIYLSTTLRSLLLIDTKSETQYVGFSFDTDTKRILIFKAKDESEGWLVAGNGRIKSSADWRELNNTYGELIYVRLESYTDDEHFPGYVFYNLYNQTQYNPQVNLENNEDRYRINDGTGIYNRGLRENPVKKKMPIGWNNVTSNSNRETSIFDRPLSELIVDTPGITRNTPEF